MQVTAEKAFASLACGFTRESQIASARRRAAMTRSVPLVTPVDDIWFLWARPTGTLTTTTPVRLLDCEQFPTANDPDDDITTDAPSIDTDTLSDLTDDENTV